MSFLLDLFLPFLRPRRRPAPTPAHLTFDPLTGEAINPMRRLKRGIMRRDGLSGRQWTKRRKAMKRAISGYPKAQMRAVSAHV